MQDTRILFVHGWGFSATFWQGLREALAEYDSEVIDLGYIQENSVHDDHIQCVLDHQTHYVAIGHSLGFIYLLNQYPIRFKHYVAINSFSKFAKDLSFPNGIAPRILDRMDKGLEINPVQLMNQFYEQCGSFVLPKQTYHVTHLKNGLDLLKYQDVRPLIPKIQHKLTVIASTHDPVVNKEMTKQSFENSNCYWVNDHTHLLPLFKIKECADIIRKNIKNV